MEDEEKKKKGKKKAEEGNYFSFFSLFQIGVERLAKMMAEKREREKCDTGRCGHICCSPLVKIEKMSRKWKEK